MGREVHVVSFEALQALEMALARFSMEVLDALNVMEAKNKHRMEILKERKHYWLHELRYWQRVYDEAEDDDGREEAARRIEEAKEELNRIHYWLKRVEEYRQIYSRQAEKLRELATRQTYKARAFINRSLDELEAYVTLQAPDSSYAAGVGTSSSTAISLEPRAGEKIIGKVPGWQIKGSDEDIQRLQRALNRLIETEIGKTIIEAIRERKTTIRFGCMENDIAAYFNPQSNEIVINDDLYNASPEVLAAYLAHEGTHVQWNRPDSIDQEYHAFRAQAEVWNRLRGNQTDRHCDYVSQIISEGEERAKKWYIKPLYPELPEY